MENADPDAENVENTERGPVGGDTAATRGPDPESTEGGSRGSSRPRIHFSRTRSVLYGLIVTIVFFCALEATLRLLYPVIRTATLPNTMIRAHLAGGKAFRYDPDLYWYWPGLPSPAMQINAYGFRRTKPMTQRKPAGVTRVVTLGDSQTLGAGVGADESYSAFAEAELGPGWEVLNAGISGYRTLNIYRLLQRHILYFQPDIVVIDCMPFDSAEDDGPLKRRSWLSRNQRVQAWLWNSALYHSLQLIIDKYRPDRARWLDQSAETIVASPGMQKGNHARIAEWGRRNGVTVVFMQYAVTQNNAVVCMTHPGELPPGHAVVPTCDRLIASGEAWSLLFQDNNHLTTEGNRIAGKAVADTLRDLKRPFSSTHPLL